MSDSPTIEGTELGFLTYYGNLYEWQWDYAFITLTCVFAACYVGTLLYLIFTRRAPLHNSVYIPSEQQSLRPKDPVTLIFFFNRDLHLVTHHYPWLESVLGDASGTFSEGWLRTLAGHIDDRLQISYWVILLITVLLVFLACIPMFVGLYGLSAVLILGAIVATFAVRWMIQVHRLSGLDEHLRKTFLPTWMRTETHWNSTFPYVSRTHMLVRIEGAPTVPSYCVPMPASMSESLTCSFAGLQSKITMNEWRTLMQATSVRFHGTKERKLCARLQEISDVLNAYFMGRNLFFEVGYLDRVSPSPFDQFVRWLFRLPRFTFENAVLCIDVLDHGRDPNSLLPDFSNPVLSVSKLHSYAALYERVDRDQESIAVSMPVSKMRLFPIYLRRDHHQVFPFTLGLGYLYDTLCSLLRARVSRGGKEAKLMDLRIAQQEYFIAAYSLFTFGMLIGTCIVVGHLFGWAFSCALFVSQAYQYVLHAIALSSHPKANYVQLWMVRLTESNAIKFFGLGWVAVILYGEYKDTIDNSINLLLMAAFLWLQSVPSIMVVRFMLRYFLNRRYGNRSLYSTDLRTLFGSVPSLQQNQGGSANDKLGPS